MTGDLNGDDVGFSHNSENVYHVVIGANNAILDGFTIQAGNANGIYPNNSGGGIYNYASSPILSNLIIQHNSAYYQGGGIYNDFE